MFIFLINPETKEKLSYVFNKTRKSCQTIKQSPPLPSFFVMLFFSYLPDLISVYLLNRKIKLPGSFDQCSGFL